VITERIKVGSGFAFLLYEAILLGLAIWLKPGFGEVAPWVFAGLGFHSGQRAYTQVKMGKYEIMGGYEENGDKNKD